MTELSLPKEPSLRKKRKPTKQWILTHLKESKCHYSEADKIYSAICHNGKYPCPCSTFDCCYQEWLLEVANQK